MHRGYGAALAKKESITVRLMSEHATEKTAMEVFIYQTDLIKKVSVADKFKAGRDAGIPEYVALDEICKKNRVCILNEEFKDGKDVGTFTCLRDGLDMAKTNPKLLDDIFKMIGRLHWNAKTTIVGKAYGAISFRAIRALYSHYGNFKKELESILINHCSGAEFWENNLDKRTQAQVFDYLSNIVNKHLATMNVMEIPTQNFNGKIVGFGA